MRIGHVPSNGVLAARVSINGARWELYDVYYPDKPCNDDWRNLKLIVRARRPKANYWFGWHIDEQRIAGARDWRILKEREPAVAAWLDLYLRDPDAARMIFGITSNSAGQSL